MILAGLKTGEIDIGIGRMSDPELMTGLNYELLFLESLKLVVRPNHPLLPGERNAKPGAGMAGRCITRRHCATPAFRCISAEPWL